MSVSVSQEVGSASNNSPIGRSWVGDRQIGGGERVMLVISVITVMGWTGPDGRSEWIGMDLR